MSELRLHDFSVSLDGFGAGAAQSEEHPLGVGGEALHEWAFGDATDVDRRFRALGTEGIGATARGRLHRRPPLRGPARACERWGEGRSFLRLSTTTCSC